MITSQGTGGEMSKLKPAEALWLLNALSESDLLSIECEWCGKPVKDHSPEELKTCMREATNGR